MEIFTDYLNKAKKESNQHFAFKNAMEILLTATDKVSLVHFEENIDDFEQQIGKVREQKFTTADRQAAIKLTVAINQSFVHSWPSYHVSQ